MRKAIWLLAGVLALQSVGCAQLQGAYEYLTTPFEEPVRLKIDPELETARVRLDHEIADAINGVGPSVEVFSELKIDPVVLAELDEDTRFSEVAYQIRTLRTSADKVRVSNALFESVSPAVLRFISANSFELAEFGRTLPKPGEETGDRAPGEPPRTPGEKIGDDLQATGTALKWAGPAATVLTGLGMTISAFSRPRRRKTAIVGRVENAEAA